MDRDAGERRALIFSSIALSRIRRAFEQQVTTMFDTLSKAGKYLGQAAKMMIGVADYGNIFEHMRAWHRIRRR